MKTISLRLSIALLTFLLGIGASGVVGFMLGKSKTQTACVKSAGFHRAGCEHWKQSPPARKSCRSRARMIPVDNLN